MPRQRHYYGLNHAYFLTASTYRRARLFDSYRFRQQFVSTLNPLRVEQGFRILGWVLMPEHIWPSEAANPSQIVQSLKERTAKSILWHLRKNSAHVWSEKKRLEKLAYMHHNPVKRGLGDSPEKCPYISFRFYFLEDASNLTIDQMP